MSVVVFTTLGTGSRKVGRATLNSEASLNSLSGAMIELLHPQLKAWADDKNIAAVILDGAGPKAFCAGGDVRRLHDAIKAGRPAEADTFFDAEYKLDYFIHTYPKPIIVWGHGIVMGGGIGLLSGASFRVVTETTKMAMPEITIGLYPDVAGSYFLNRVPEGVGLFLGLTGARFNAADALFTKLGNVFIKNALKDKVISALQQLSWTDHPASNKKLINEMFRTFEKNSLDALPQGELSSRMATINQCATVDSVSHFLNTLEERVLITTDPYLQTALKSLQSGSPTSARVIFEQIHRARGLTLEECFALELILSKQFVRHPDFVEGVRALLVDKDNKPRWSKKSIQDVSDALVEEHFRVLA